MRKIYLNSNFVIIPLVVVLLIFTGCSSTKHLAENEVLLKKNTIKIKSFSKIKNIGEIRDNLYRLEAQRPNSYSWLFRMPVKLLHYNYRYKKFHNLPDSLLPKSVERPVIFDSSLITKSNQNFKNYLFNLGYFFVKIKDTFYIKNQKSYVQQTIYTGKNYKINNFDYDVSDSAILKILNDAKNESAIQKEKNYSIALVDDERSRLVSLIRNNGYYHFTQDNIVTFSLDTNDRTFFKDAESPFEGVINFITNNKIDKAPTVDINVVIRPTDDTNTFKKYYINKINVYPDYKNTVDLFDSTLLNKFKDSINFFYHNKYVNAGVLANHIFIKPQQPFSQADYDVTLAKLNELGLFQYIRISFTESADKPNYLDCNIIMNKSNKYDISLNDELSNGTTYILGLSGGINFHNKNFEKGANLFTLSLNGGIEYAYLNNTDPNFINHFKLLTENLGLNASIDFPKFITPIGANVFDNFNLPHTIISGGSNLINRIDYFKLVNTSLNYTYNWKKTKTVTWTLSPVFFNIIRMPFETDSFKAHLSQYPFLKNSYKANFIEGENISFTYNDIEKKRNKNYTYLRLSLEESGSVLNVLNQLGVALNDLYKIKYAQYSKFDFDLRHFFTFPHSTLAVRLWGGVGVPYGQSNTLPYIKQYYVGGPYSLRGWQIRALGPGSYYDSANLKNSVIDLTGDVKLEMNTEYRFLIAPLFAGAIKMNGAFFVDAGNIWLAKRDTSFRGGEFELNTLGKCMAVDVGIGTRFDIASFLTFRIDLAMPVKKPYITKNEGWTFNEVNFGNQAWRSNNLVLNIAIGYPF